MIQVGMKLIIASRRLISKYRDGKEKKKKTHTKSTQNNRSNREMLLNENNTDIMYRRIERVITIPDFNYRSKPS